MANFIPSFHFDHPDDKLKPQWCEKVKNYYYYNLSRFNLLRNKNVRQIEQYYTGDIDMTVFKRMFKSMKKKLNALKNNADGTMNNKLAQDIDTIGLDWEPLALIPSIMNSAISNILKVPADVTCKAQDALAMKKQKEDIDFLKNKPAMEADLGEVAQQLGVGEVDLGTTKHSSRKFSAPPMGLDLNDPEHEEVFLQLFYSLQVQTAFEKALEQVYTVKHGDVKRFMATRDQFKFGVSALNAYNSSITGLPDVDYIHPSRVECPDSELPDFSDNEYRVIDYEMTVEQMFNYFSNEICDEAYLEKIINGSGDGYCACNGRGSVSSKNFNTMKVNLKQVQVKSIDWVGVKKANKKSKFEEFTMNEKECSSKVWGQNTYTFYWLFNTNYYFRIEKVPYTYRQKGNEAYQNFPSIIYKSQEKSAVELSIASNKNAIIANIKMQHALIKSAPPGKYIDLRFLRNALKGLKQENSGITIDDLITMVFEHNHFLGDTEGFDGKNDGQMKPFMDIPGGLKNEVSGYLQLILAESEKISTLITGINKNLTGQSAEELVGLQQMKINSGLTAIDYCNDAIKYSLEVLYNIWGSNIQTSIEAGGKTKEGVVDMIGDMDAELLDSLDEAPLHKLTLKVDIGQRMFQMKAVNDQIAILDSKGVLTAADKYLLDGISNPREKFQKLYFIEERYQKQQAEIRQEQMANMQAIEKQRSDTVLASTQMKGQQNVQGIAAKGKVDEQLMVLGAKLGLTAKQVEGLINRQLQKERNDGQTQKGIETIKAKKEAELQAPLGA